MSDDMERLRAAVDGLETETIKDVLCAALSRPSRPGPEREAQRKGKWDDFEQLDSFASLVSLLKRRFEFPELAKFTIEAGTVFIENAGRKVEITVPASMQATTPSIRANPPAPPGRDNPGESAVRKPERFMNLEMDI